MRKLLKRIAIISLLGLCTAMPECVALAVTFSAQASQLYNDAIYSYRTRHFELAKQKLAEIMEKYPEDGYASVARVQLAHLLRELKEHEKAIELNKEIISKHTSANEILNAKMEIVGILGDLQRFREAIELLEEWRQADLGNVDLARKLAALYLQSGRTDEAWLLLETFMERGNEEAFSDLLSLAMKTGEVEKLINNLEARRAKFKYAVYVGFFADCYLALGEKDKAIKALMEAPKYDKDSALLRKLSDIQMSANLTDDAIDSLERLIKLLPYDWQSLKKLGHCYFLKKEKEKAIEIWKRPLVDRKIRGQEGYMQYTTVLIEHQLLEEALAAFEDARRELFNPTLFAEEKAAVLDALNREPEALEEYLAVLTTGVYKTENFNKLYNANVKGFSLEKRLTEMNKKEYNQAVAQALVEYYFRKARIEDINKMVSVFDDSTGFFFDDLFYDRLKQEALLVPEQFHFNLMKRLIEVRKASSLELKLATLILRLPEYSEKWKSEAYSVAKAVADKKDISDTDLYFGLCQKLAEYAFYTMKSAKEADDFLGIVLQRDYVGLSPQLLLEAKLFRAVIRIYMSDFDGATAMLDEIESQIKNLDYSNEIGMRATEEDDFKIQLKYEKALLRSHKGDYQESLDLLKDIIEKHKEGKFVNNAIELANEITRLSFGDFSFIKHKQAYERLAACGKNTEAVTELEEALKVLPEGKPALVAELNADKLLLSDKQTYNAALVKEIETFIVANEKCYKNADLAELKIKLLERNNTSKEVMAEEMRHFLTAYPNDLRCGKYRQSLENGGNKNEAK